MLRASRQFLDTLSARPDGGTTRPLPGGLGTMAPFLQLAIRGEREPMSAQPRTIRLEDYTPPAYRVEHTDLHFDLRPEGTRVRARLRLRRNGTGPAPLWLDGEGQRLLGVALDGRSLEPGEYRLAAGGLEIPDPPAEFGLEILSECDPARNTALEGLYLSSGMFCTQCEAEGFRRITYYPDRPDVLARFTVTLEADEARCPVLLSNGNRVAQGRSGNGRHWARWEDPHPKPSYLFALVAGDLACRADRFVTASGREVRLEIYTTGQDLPRTAHAMESLKRAMAWDEARYGLEYDLDVYMIVAVADFNMGAMENKGLNVFNTRYVLADPETATDGDFRAIEAVIGHEYFHNWTGNRVTCRDWFQLSLKEGLTVFRDQEFSADMGSAAVKRIEDVRLLRKRQFPEDDGPMAHPVRPREYVEINNFYTATVYEKGAEVVRMYQTLLGREGFRRGMDLYFRRHDGQAVTTDDFRAAMADANGVDLSRFARWYDQAGTPVLRVHSTWHPGARRLELELEQSCPPTPGQAHKDPVPIPLALGLLNARGESMPVRLAGEGEEAAATTRVLLVQEARQRVELVGVDDEPVPSLLRGFSAPVRLEYPYTPEELALLYAHDPDPFNRWEAGQRLAMAELLAMVAVIGEGGEPRMGPHFAAAFGRQLESDGDMELTACALGLPGEEEIADRLEEVDPEAVHLAREAAMGQLAAEFEQALAAVHERTAGAPPGDLGREAVGRRALRNTVLAFLGRLDSPAVWARMEDQYRRAANMTERLAAFEALVNSSSPWREDCIEDFHRRYRADPLVLDKWFAAQARSRRADTLERVRALWEHPDFVPTNPNKVRALLGAFASGNPARFHDPSGAGYRFVADRILELDRMNPQVAARVLGAFTRWRRLEPVRRERMRQELERIAAAPRLSPDCYEIAHKSLAAEGAGE